MRNTLNYDFLNCLRKMPPLRHSIPNVPFDIMNSEAARWIASQPEVVQKMFNMASNRKVIEYDRDTGKWQGADYGD